LCHEGRVQASFGICETCRENTFSKTEGLGSRQDQVLVTRQINGKLQSLLNKNGPQDKSSPGNPSKEWQTSDFIKKGPGLKTRSSPGKPVKAMANFSLHKKGAWAQSAQD